MDEWMYYAIVIGGLFVLALVAWVGYVSGYRRGWEDRHTKMVVSAKAVRDMDKVRIR